MSNHVIHKCYAQKSYLSYIIYLKKNIGYLNVQKIKINNNNNKMWLNVVIIYQYDYKKQ